MVVEDSPDGTQVTASNEEDDESFRYSFAILVGGFLLLLEMIGRLKDSLMIGHCLGFFFKDCWGSLINHWKLERFYPSSFFFIRCSCSTETG